MNKEFIPYDLAIQFRELGFDEECIGFYNIHLDVIPIDSEPYTTKSIDGAILYQQAFRWFREKYNLRHSLPSRLWNRYSYSITDFEDFKDEYDGGFDTYEKAELACLEKLIEIVKNK